MSIRITGLCLILLLAGCTANPITELEKVAKNWSLTIRASQVIPVYPPSEDIQPGDVYLVQNTISEQVTQYEEDGFLPLDQQVTRLSRDKSAIREFDYENYYGTSYFPARYNDPSNNTRCAAIGTSIRAPRVAFPSYSFSVSRSSGLSLALPIQGIPVALGIMNASSANGTITLDDAYTYGLDSEHLYRAVSDWYFADPNRAGILKTYTKPAVPPTGTADTGPFLRVITRVYVARNVNVTLMNSDTTSVGGSADTPTSLSMITLNSDGSSDTLARNAENYASAMNAINTTLSGTDASSTTGASFRIVDASSRSVSLEGQYECPIVIGYRGFDVKVFADGSLSAPIPSFSTIAGAQPTFQAYNRSYGIAEGLRTLGKLSTQQQRQSAQAISTCMGQSFSNTYNTALDSQPNNPVKALNDARKTTTNRAQFLDCLNLEL